MIEQIQSFWVGVDWGTLSKSTGLWLLVWAFYMSLIQSTLITLSGIVLTATGKTEESLSGAIAICSMLWGIFIMVHFY